MKQSGPEGQTVIVAMSGGVDSSVAALLLLQQGWRVVGATMDTGYGQAPVQAAQVCADLGIPHQVVDGRQLFQRQVAAFCQAYLRGETPNPCVDCNRLVKFPIFLPLMEQLGAERLATGHYIRILEVNGRYALAIGADPAKDQSYFLYRLPQEILSRCLFPLGQLTKAQVRELAVAHGISSAGQKDSYDVCFVPEGDYRRLLREQAPEQLIPGDIIDSSGRVLGRHNGLANYTLGQRRGLEIAVGAPLYVIELDMEHNRLVVGPKDSLLCREALTRENNFLPLAALEGPLRAEVRIRYRAVPAPALLEPAGEDLVRIRFDEPQWGVTPGQSAVFYQGELLLGGGKIVKK